MLNFNLIRMPEEVYFILQILLAIILGGLIGWQRERLGKSAGARTYALVTAGAALFTLLSVNAFAAQPAIVAAQIVTGIGFLGAGSILHRESRIEGLTTAAGLWIAAAIGMSVGLKYYLLSVLGTLIVLLVLFFDSEKLAGKKEIEKN